MKAMIRSIQLAIIALMPPIAASAQIQPYPVAVQAGPGGDPHVVWKSVDGHYYDLWSTRNLVDWAPVEGFPKRGTGGLMQETRQGRSHEFFRMTKAPGLDAYMAPEVAAYREATGISEEAANEINRFLRFLRLAGVEPALFWVGGTRYGSISGGTARAVIGGNGSVVGTLGMRGQQYETFTGTQSLQFANPLKSGSQSRVGFFAGATPAVETYNRGLITGGETTPRGPRLGAAWAGGSFHVFDQAGAEITHNGFGGFANSGSFLPYVGAAYDGYYSVLCGIGKSVSGPEHPLRWHGMPQDRFPEDNFVNCQDYIHLGSPDFVGKLHFAVVTADDLTDNQRVYETISIPRRSGFGKYGIQTAVVFLGDSITYGYAAHVTDSTGISPAHMAGGQWNRNAQWQITNGTGEGNSAQIAYYELGAKYALDGRTWDHVFFVCGSGGHYETIGHNTQNPLTQEAKDSIDAWIDEYHQRIAMPAAATGAKVVQMTYIYGCPHKFSTTTNPEIYRAFSDYLAMRQRIVAAAAGFVVFDVYAIPQLHTALKAFYADHIHPNAAGYRLIAQEFAATVANPISLAPRSLERPAISGTPKVGSTLTATTGSWEESPASHAWQWMRDASDIPGATATTYQVQNIDNGYHLSCRVTATNIHGSAERTSAHSAMISP